MPKVLLAAAITVGLAATSAVAVAGPPVITEPFTLLPCPAKPTTTLDLEGCAERRIVATDKAIDARVRTIFALLRSRRSSRAVANFVRGERAWLTSRRAVCTSRADL